MLDGLRFHRDVLQERNVGAKRGERGLGDVGGGDLDATTGTRNSCLPRDGDRPHSELLALEGHASLEQHDQADCHNDQPTGNPLVKSDQFTISKND